MNKIDAARQAYENWVHSLGIKTLEDVAKVLDEGGAIRLINLCEARQERQYADVADQISWHHVESPIVMMSGPSSSGKTSSSKRIAQQCEVLGLRPKVIELDNYFVDREHTPKDEEGNYDFEALAAMDIELLGQQLSDLLAGKEVELPRFDFKSGHRVFEGKMMRFEENDVLFMEGIHALNPALTPDIPASKKFNVYISALTALPGGEKVHNTTADKRLLRRIVRDNRTRGITPEETLLRWPSVRAGEIKNIFPYDGNADVVFNSSTLYDIPLLKYYAEPLLYGIAESSPAYAKAQELLALMSKIRAFKPAEIAAVPTTSIMREFIGGQTL